MKRMPVLTLALALFSSSASAATTWNVDFFNGTAFGMNNHGDVVGYTSAGTHNEAFLYRDGQYTMLGSLNPAAHASSYAKDINDSGTIIGHSEVNYYDTGRIDYWTTSSFIYKNGAMRAGALTESHALNNSGEVAGRLDRSPALENEATGQVRQVPLLPGGVDAYANAYSINDSGRAAGAINIKNNDPYGWDWLRAAYYDGTNLVDIGNLGREQSEAYFINNNDVILGRAWNGDSFMYGYSDLVHFVYYHGQVMEVPDGYAITAINDYGQMIAQNFEPTNRQVWYYDWRTGERINLTDMLDADGAQLAAEDINNAGQILLRSNRGSYLLSPVPEPESFGLLLAGLAGLGWQRRRQRRQAKVA